MGEYRFSTVTTPANGETTIYRGRLVRLGDLGYTDMWENYWDGDCMVGFTEDWHFGSRHVSPVHNDDENARAVAAYMHGGVEALEVVARRITGSEDARFIHVSLDRGTDFYALAWDGDPDNQWRDEIEAVWNGDVYRIETEEYDGENWQPADDVCEEFYGERQAEVGFEKEFPLTEFPAEVLVGSAGA